MAIAMMSWMLAIPVLGFCTGLRTMTPMAVLCWFAYRHTLPLYDTWGFWAGMLVTAMVFTALAAGELIGDKLPSIPNRTSAFPLIGRTCFGGLVGALAATGLHGYAVEGILLGAISAVAGAFVGFQVRSLLKKRIGCSDLPVALIEDVLAITASVVAMGIVTG